MDSLKPILEQGTVPILGQLALLWASSLPSQLLGGNGEERETNNK